MVSLALFVLAAASISNPHDVVLLEFTQAGCAPCQAMEPVVRRLEANGYPIRRLDVGQQAQLARQLQVAAVPCFLLVAGGQVVDRVEGATSYERLAQMFSAARPAPRPDAAPTPPVVRGQSPEPRSGGLGGLGRFGSLFNRSTPPTTTPIEPPADPFSRLAPAAASPFPSPATPQSASLQATSAAASPSGAFGSSLPDTIGSNAPGSNALGVDRPAFGTTLPERTDVGPGAGLRAVSSTVRLKVEDPQGHSLGTGTIIDMHGQEALIVTCGHIFRESKGQGAIEVEMFGAHAGQSQAGVLVDYDLKRDIGLVSIRVPAAVTVARVAPSAHLVRKGDRVFSVGCDRGAPPTVRDSHVTSVNKYIGPPNIEVAGQPVDGRSGGGLFTADGQLIGVCNAADPADREGIYAALATIHWQLDQIGQQRIYQPNGPSLASNGPSSQSAHAQPSHNMPAAPPPMPVTAPTFAVAPAGFSSAPDLLSAAPSRSEAMPFRDTSDRAPAAPGMSTRGAAALPADSEVICIVRSKSDPAGKSRMIVLDQIPAELLERLTQPPGVPDAATLGRDLTPTPSVVRGQGQ